MPSPHLRRHLHSFRVPWPANQRMQLPRARFAWAAAALQIELRGCAAAAAPRPRS